MQSLADPNDKPGADIVIWDGECKFCLKQILRLRWFDSQEKLAYLSLHDPRVSQLLPDLTFEQLMAQMWVTTVAGDRFGGADAIRHLSFQLPRMWWMRIPLSIPGAMPVWRWLYRKTAERRYRIAGKNCDEGGTCHLHR